MENKQFDKIKNDFDSILDHVEELKDDKSISEVQRRKLHACIRKCRYEVFVILKK